jgi:hypothetical protein
MNPKSMFLAVTLIALSVAPSYASVIVNSGSGPQSTYAVSNTDLANQGQSTFSTLVQNSGSALFDTNVNGLNDGLIYEASNNPTHTGIRQFAPSNTPSVVTLTFDTSTNTFGYDIVSVVSMTFIETRAGQAYDLAYSLVATPSTFVSLTGGDSGSLVNRPTSAQEGQVTITDSTGTIASGVKALRFTFYNSGGNESVFAEIDVTGTATIVPEPVLSTLSYLFGVAFIARFRRRRQS